MTCIRVCLHKLACIGTVARSLCSCGVVLVVANNNCGEENIISKHRPSILKQRLLQKRVIHHAATCMLVRMRTWHLKLACTVRSRELLHKSARQRRLSRPWQPAQQQDTSLAAPGIPLASRVSSLATPSLCHLESLTAKKQILRSRI